MFTGTLRVKICEANDLRPTDYQKRHELNFGKNNDKKDLDPYVSLNVDEKFIGEYECAYEMSFRA
jgi:novel protein kinase C epsilon type